MTQQRETLARALDRVAGEIERALAEATSIHEQYSRLCTAVASSQLDTELAQDDALRRRTQAGLYAGNLLVDQLRTQARLAQERFPTVDHFGQALPPAPPSTEPAEVLRWWQALTSEQQADLVEHQTFWVGSTDGVPMRARHRANLRLLDTELHGRADQLTEDGREPLADLDEKQQRDLRGLLKLRMLFSAEAQANSEDMAGITTPIDERFLYLLDAREYPLRAGVVLGDLDAADHIVLHVPGATTTIDLRLFREMVWMSNLRTEVARLLGSTRRIAILDWIGYQAPYDIATKQALGNSGASVLVPGEASDDQYARAGAPHLARCGEGLRAIGGPQVRLVASGHSYGASVFGLAMQITDVFDVAMVAGCPGMFITSVDELKLPEHSLYAAVAPGDVVALLNFFGQQVIQVPGVQILAPVPRTTTYPGGQRSLLKLTVGHETYYDLGSVSLHGMAGIVVGDLARVKTTSLAWLSRITGIANNATVVAPVLGRGSA